MADILVFITATIHCGDTPFVKRCNPEERKRDYLTAFKGWLAMKHYADILFCENSNADLSLFREANNAPVDDKSVQIITFKGNAEAQKRGKGYGEIEMLRYAFNLMPELRDYRYILKVTGRYQLKNAVDMIKKISQMKADFICDIHANLTYGGARTVAFTPKVALDYLIPYQNELDDRRGAEIENLMARCLHRVLIDGGSWAPLPTTPFCHGFSGTTNSMEPDTVIYRVKQAVKRKIARWIYS